MNETDYNRFLEFLKFANLPYNVRVDCDGWEVSLGDDGTKSGHERSISFNFDHDDCDRKLLRIWSWEYEKETNYEANFSIEAFDLDKWENSILEQKERKHCKSEKMLNSTIGDLELVPMGEHRLKEAGIVLVKDLVDKTEHDLLKIPGLGRYCLKDIKGRLEYYELSLKK